METHLKEGIIHKIMRPEIQILWNYLNAQTKVEKADIIIGLGSYDVRVAKHCADLYLANLANLMVFTGNQGNWTRGKWPKPEAQIFADEAIKKGVPERKIILENDSTNMGDNIRFSKALLKDLNRPIKSIIAVTKPNTTRRLLATLDIEWPEVKYYITSPPFQLQDMVTPSRTLKELTNEMVGDFQRLEIYAKQGLQSKQHVPNEVISAYKKLLSLGFTEHLIK